MKKEFWYKIQQDMLGLKGAWLLFLLAIALSYVGPIIPDMTFLSRLLLNLIGVVLVAAVYFIAKSERSKKQSRILCFYEVVFSLGCIAAYFEVKPLHLIYKLFP